MGQYTDQLTMQAGGGALGAVMGLALGGYNDERQRRQQRELQNLQIAGSKELTDYNMKKQLEMWNATNFKEQIRQMKMAGLSPGLIYGNKGAGGMITGTPGGTPSGGSAPVGGGEIPSMMGMGLNLEMLRAQIANINADTKNKEATTPKIETETKSLAQGISNQKAQEALTKMDTEIKTVELRLKNTTFREQEDIIIATAAKMKEELGILETQNLLDREQRILKTDLLRQQLANMVVQNAVMEKGMKVSDAQMQKWTAEIAQSWSQIDIHKKEMMIKAIEADIKTNYPGLWNVIGGFLYGTSKKLGEIFGDTPNISAQEKVK